MESWEPVFFQLQEPWNKLFLWVLLKPDFSSQLPREEGRAFAARQQILSPGTRLLSAWRDDPTR